MKALPSDSAPAGAKSDVVGGAQETEEVLQVRPSRTLHAATCLAASCCTESVNLCHQLRLMQTGVQAMIVTWLLQTKIEAAEVGAILDLLRDEMKGT